MDEREYLARQFDIHRTHLRAVAYRMLGSSRAAGKISLRQPCWSAA